LACRTIARNGFWFIDVPRTSSTTIRYELGKRFGSVYGKRNVIETAYATKQVLGDHMPAVQVRDMLGRTRYGSLFTFAFVRNPWDRTLSMYHYRHKRGSIPASWTFEDYLDRLANRDGPIFNAPESWQPASYYLCDEGMREIVTYVGRFEERSAALEFVQTEIGDGSFEFGDTHLQSAKPPAFRDYRRAYSDRGREIVESIYRTDVARYCREIPVSVLTCWHTLQDDALGLLSNGGYVVVRLRRTTESNGSFAGTVGRLR
jgi:hypothetical protein